jgi:hypothetical protein
VFESSKRLQQGFLGDVFRIRAVVQNAARYPKRQRPALLEALFELPPQRRLFAFKRQLGLRRATGPDQGNFLHPFSPYNCQTPPSGAGFKRS